MEFGALVMSSKAKLTHCYMHDTTDFAIQNGVQICHSIPLQYMRTLIVALTRAANNRPTAS
jgi:hypothetical protein